jgi:hypothetical protein
MKFGDQRGFSTVEGFVAAAMSAVVLAGVVSFNQMQSTTLSKQTKQLENQSMARNAMELFAREIRVAGVDPTCAANFDGIVSASGSMIHIQADLDGSGTIEGGSENVTYQFDSGSASFLRFQDSGSDALLTGVSAAKSKLRYFDGDGAELGMSSALNDEDRAAVRRVRIELTIVGRSGEENSTSALGVNLSTDVNLRSRFFLKAIECS